MASEHQVRQYLAYWFQLGKQIMLDGGETAMLPQPVVDGDRYSAQFEECWQKVIAPESGDCYLEGTSQTIAQLLTPSWDISPCARCSMPVAMPNVGVSSLECPCIDLMTWPNLEIPQPRGPINSQARLTEIRDRLRQSNYQNNELQPSKALDQSQTN